MLPYMLQRRSYARISHDKGKEDGCDLPMTGVRQAVWNSHAPGRDIGVLMLRYQPLDFTAQPPTLPREWFDDPESLGVLGSMDT